MENALYTLEEETEEFEELQQKELNKTKDNDIDSLLGKSTIISLPKDQINSVKTLNIEKNIFYKYSSLLKGRKAKNLFFTENVDEFIKENPSATKCEVKNNLIYDTFNVLYKRNPIIISKERMKEPYNVVNDLIREIINEPKFKKLKESTTLDYKTSLLASDSVLENLLTYESQLIKSLEKQNNLQKDLDEINSRYNGLKDLDGKTNKEIQNIIDKIKRELSDKKAEMDNCEDDITIYIRTYGSDIKEDIKQGLNNGVYYAEDIKNFFECLGSEYKDDEDGNSDEPLDKKTIANMKNLLLSQVKFERLVNLLGYMVTDATAKAKRKKTNSGSIPDSIKTGNKITDVLGSSLSYLANPKTKKLFYKNYVEKNLLVKDKMDYSEQGPIIVCLDKSGSMNSSNRDIWGAAISIACLQSAKIQKRNYRLIRFNAKADYFDYIPKSKEKALPKILDICTTHCGGGTYFTPPIELALESIKNSKFRDASILFLTDGIANLDYDIFKQAKRVKKNKNFRMYTVYLGNSGANDYLNDLSDETYQLDNLMGENAKDTAQKIFTEISKI